VSCSLAKDFDRCSKVITEEIIDPFTYPQLQCQSSTVGSDAKVKGSASASKLVEQCESENTVIKPETLCNVETAGITCSGSQIAQCAHVSTSTGVVGKYVYTACSPGTTCQLLGDTAACVIDSSCAA
jgi:hypothetical protein